MEKIAMVAKIKQIDVPYAATAARVQEIRTRLAALRLQPASAEREVMIATIQAHLQAAEQWLAGLMEISKSTT